MTGRTMLSPATENFLGEGLWASVVVTTFNRPENLTSLVQDFATQSVAASKFEVIVLDDGSTTDIRTFLDPASFPFSLVLMRQDNAGAAKARQAAISVAKGRVLVLLDDDMRVAPRYLEEHLRLHDGPSTVVMGQRCPPPITRDMPLFEKFFVRMLTSRANDYATGKVRLRGHHIYTGNLSIDRELFVRVGGFDQEFRALEDEELGIRLEKGGGRLLFTTRGSCIDCSNKQSLKAWLARCQNDGTWGLRVARKHVDVPETSVFRYLREISPMSKPFVLLSLGAPEVAKPLSEMAMRAAVVADQIGLERLAIAGATLVYGIQYYSGVRREAGSLGALWGEYRAFRDAMGRLEHGGAGRETEASYASFAARVKQDHDFMLACQKKYGAGGESAGGGLLADAVKKIGFQILVGYRLTRLFRARGDLLAAQFTSRLMRHLYGSDIHWDAEIAPGVMIVHGFALAISHSARVSQGCILSHGVTLGWGRNTDGHTGAPVLEENVHVGVGATLYGPITVGAGSKVMAGTVLSQNVPPRSLVESSRPTIAPRT